MKGVIEDMAKTGRFRGYFLRGLAVLLPTVLTIWLVLWGFNFINDKISVHIKRGIILLIKSAGGTEDELSKFWISTGLSVAGFLIAVGLVYVVGMILGSMLGRTAWKQIENFIMSTPLLKQVYPFFKQISDFFFNQEESKKMFTRVVAVEYPRKGVWSIGLVTGTGLKKIEENVEKEFLTVFIATTPSPLTGFLVIVPKDEVMDLDMPIEEAFQFIISAGLITPGAKVSPKESGSDYA
jgi:uncharacterized membrane protein